MAEAKSDSPQRSESPSESGSHQQADAPRAKAAREILQRLRELTKSLVARDPKLIAQSDSHDMTRELGITLQRFLPIIEEEQSRNPFWADAGEGFLTSALAYVERHGSDQESSLHQAITQLRGACREQSPLHLHTRSG